MILSLLALLSVGSAFTLALNKPIADIPETGLAAVGEIIPQETAAPFPEVALEAKAAVVFDVHRGIIIFEKNGDAQLPLASLTKLMTAAVAEDLLAEDTVITIRAEHVRPNDSAPLLVGEHWNLKDLLDFTLMASSNSGAAALSGAAEEALSLRQEGSNTFLARMNAKAHDLGLTGTYFINETGLDHSGELAGNSGSARDIAKLFSYLILKRPLLLEATRYPKLTFTTLENTSHTARNTDTALPFIPNLIGSKTGFTDLAGGNLAVAYDAGIGHPVIVVVLGSTEAGRFSDVKKLVDAALQCVNTFCAPTTQTSSL
ncbi:MAG TPA: hypothetical protein VJI74_03640 [Candidatus Paceibacterota bacterium]